jgi:hypothetical protein
MKVNIESPYVEFRLFFVDMSNTRLQPVRVFREAIVLLSAGLPTML